MRRAACRALVVLAAAAILWACAATPAAPAPAPATPAELTGLIVSVGFDDDLWISRPDGSARRRLTTDGSDGAYRSPRWSPDGRFVAAVRFPPPADLSRLVLIDVAGGSTRVLSRLEVSGFSWSPDGQRLAVAVGEHMRSTIQIIDLASGAWRGVAQGSAPAWSPVDDRVAFETPDGRIAVVEPSGAITTLASPDAIARVTKSDAGIRALYWPSWSRDGKRIGFVAVERMAPADAPQYTIVGDARPNGEFRAWPVGVPGHLHDFPQPVWSPTRDVFVATDVWHVPHVHHLWIGRRGDDLRLLDEAKPHFLNVAWSPDGGVLLLSLDELRAWKLFWVDSGRSVEVREGGGMWPDWCCRAGRQ